MLLWILLFLIIVGVSFFLALRSMKDYQEFPASTDISYGLFLIRNPNALNEDVLESIRKLIFEQKLIISLEKLSKGNLQALIIYGPTRVLSSFKETLNLLELEEYSGKIKIEKSLAWEIGIKDGINDLTQQKLILPQLHSDEELWWQIVLQGAEGNFQTTLRAVLIGVNMDRTKDLKEQITKLLENFNLIMLPQAYSTTQIINFYQKRTLSKPQLPKGAPQRSQQPLTSKEIQKLLNIS